MAQAVVAVVLLGAAIVFASPAHALTKPSAPRALSGFAGYGVGQATLKWLAPADTGGGVASYLYDVATDSNPSTHAATWSGLTDLRRRSTRVTVPCAASYPAVCTYRVYARNVAGTSLPSSPFSVPWAVPSAARALKATTTNFSDVSLTWRAPVRSGGLPELYDAQVSNDQGVTWTTVASNRTALTYAAAGSCTNGFSCQYRVWAKNAAGTASVTSNVYVVGVTPGYLHGGTVSKTADDVTIGNGSSGQATMSVTWRSTTTGLHDGPDQLQQCQGVCTSLAFNWSAVVSVPNGTFSATRTCPAGAIGCSFRVRATNTRGGAGQWAYIAYKPTAPIDVSATTGGTAGTVSVTFSGPSDAGPASVGAQYEFLVCTTGCDTTAGWSTSATTVAYPPAAQPETTEVDCPVSGASCSVRVQYVGADTRSSMLSPSATATAA